MKGNSGGVVFENSTASQRTLGGPCQVRDPCGESHWQRGGQAMAKFMMCARWPGLRPRGPWMHAHAHRDIQRCWLLLDLGHSRVWGSAVWRGCSCREMQSLSYRLLTTSRLICALCPDCPLPGITAPSISNGIKSCKAALPKLKEIIQRWEARRKQKMRAVSMFPG